VAQQSVTIDDRQPHVSARCPFCGGTYTAGISTEGDGILIHSMPPCDKFSRLEMCDFMQAARLVDARVLS
jgi:hypothetical protein